MGKETNKSGLINNFVCWTIVTCASIITLTLVISWVLWLTLYKLKIDEILKFFDNKTMAQGYGINFNFSTLSIIVFLIVIFAILFALMLLFYRKKTGLIIIVSLFNFILAATILVSETLFVIISYNTYIDFYTIYGLNDTLLIFLPWAIVLIFDSILIFTSLWNLISTVNWVIFAPDIETEAKSLVHGREETLPDEEKIIAYTDQIIVPKQAPLNQPDEKIKLNENLKDNHNLEIEPQKEIKIQTKPEEESVISTSQLSPFIVYRENKQGTYVLLKDHETNQENISLKKNSEDDGELKYQGISTPKIEDITQIISNPEPSVVKSTKEKIKPITNWSKEQIDEVWNKAQVIDDVNPKLYRKDYAGAWMFKEAFTNQLEEVSVRSYTWTIVNHCPLSHGGDNSIANLDPMNVINAITKGENYPKWKTKISSSGNENIIKEQTWKARI